MSNDVVIKVENLSKQYRIGGAKEGYKTFRETLIDATRAPFSRLSSLLSSQGSKLSSHDDFIWALKDVSFEVKRSEVVGIIGRNGAGKSTILKILSKITEPTEGRIELRGRVGSLLEVGTGFHPELTGHENVYMYGAILGMDRWEVTRKFDEIVAFAGIEKFIETPVKRYSTGMYMRLAFAVAAHMEPEILLVDEVLAVGDMAFQKKCMGKMESVAGEGRTVLFVSHNMATIQGLCHKTMLIESGKIVFEGKTSKAIEQYTLSGEVFSDAKISMKEHPNRVPECEPVLQDVEVRVNGELSTNVGMGEDLEVSVCFESIKPIRSIGLSVEDNFGQRIFIVSSYYSNPDLLSDSNTSGKLVCSISDLPLLPGAYFITILVGGFTELLDKVERAIGITVVERDVFKTGVRLGKDKGLIYKIADWRLDNSI
ncbi:ABC transporter ATP-binding protein [Thermodesulfobacteriota bacterium]